MTTPPTPPSAPPHTVSEVGEKPTIRRLTAIATRHSAAIDNRDIRVGSGDDAAVLLSQTGSDLVVTCDMAVEGRHFRHDWSTPQEIGQTVAIRNLADVAAMGGAPRHLFVSLGIPAQTPVAALDDLMEGICATAAQFGAVVTGGDLVQAPQWVVSITATGTVTTPVTLDGARPGDVVWGYGQSGYSAAGYALLVADWHTRLDELDAATAAAAHRCIQAFRAPVPPLEIGEQLAGCAHSLTDTSDGLVSDLGDIAHASGVEIALHPEALSPADDLVAIGRLLGVDPQEWLLHGGEDHVLVGTSAPNTTLPTHPDFRLLGEVRTTDHPHVSLAGQTFHPAGFSTFDPLT